MQHKFKKLETKRGCEKGGRETGMDNKNPGNPVKPVRSLKRCVVLFSLAIGRLSKVYVYMSYEIPMLPAEIGNTWYNSGVGKAK